MVNTWFFISFKKRQKMREKNNFCQISQFKTSTHSQVLPSRCFQKAPSYPPHYGVCLLKNALTGSPLGLGRLGSSPGPILGRCAIQKKNWPLGWRLILGKMQGSLSKRLSSSTGQMVAAHLAAQNKANKLAGCVAGKGPRTLRFDLQMNCQPRE